MSPDPMAIRDFSPEVPGKDPAAERTPPRERPDEKPERSPLDAWLAARMGLDGPSPTPKDVARHQLAALGRTLALVREKSPFYRERLAGLPRDFPRTLADMADCPFTTPADLAADHRPFVCAPLSEIAHMVTLSTSGTTGPAKRLGFTAADVEATVDFFHHGMATFTRPGDAVLIILPGPRVAELLALALLRLGARGTPGSLVRPDPGDGDPAAAFVRDMDRVDARVLVAGPWQLETLIQALPAVRAARGRLGAVLSSGGPLAPALRDQVQDRFGCPVFDHYGLTETGFGGGVECAARAGYHLRDADLFFEIVDPVTGRVLPPGRMGEVVVTTLGRQGMPLVRYRTGDASALLDGPCPCGGRTRRLRRVAGRFDQQGRVVVPQKGGTNGS
ncbi:DVU_1553 family AMP-dependent CoA ligase [Desulfolutivibrio sulfoxidireducens]|uniref:DVU_1553 family AMP-dependent CoA ligase n=1 Tax=Desulfolutivibrio sulfoxidireducens TaxID=2773299 RepID=UPI001FE62817|nr:AMP-binding protein [Desulfolutivibrio sulfoxidireducens]